MTKVEIKDNRITLTVEKFRPSNGEKIQVSSSLRIFEADKLDMLKQICEREINECLLKKG